MYQSLSPSMQLRPTILENLYTIIVKTLDSGSYALKGGYILSKLLPEFRRSTFDIDISIESLSTFTRIVENLSPYLEDLIQQGLIYSYSCKDPSIKGSRNVSGYIKLYVKSNANSKKVVLCGIDFDLKLRNSRLGVSTLQDGSFVYSFERMLADKVSALYSTEKILIHRVRDIVDIYLILINSKNLNLHLILSLAKTNGADLNTISTFEMLVSTKRTFVKDELTSCIHSDRFNKSSLGISVKDLIQIVLQFIYILRNLS